MATIKCFYCKQIHNSIADVKACATAPAKPVNVNVTAGPAKGADAVAAFLASTAPKAAMVSASPEIATAINAAGGFKEYIQAKKAVKTLDEVLGADVNPDPAAELDKWAAEQIAASNAYNEKLAEYAAKVEIGTIVETIIPATIKKVSIPAHKAAKSALIASGKLTISAPVNAAEPVEVVHENLSEIQAVAKEQVLKTGQDLELGMYQTVDADGKITIYKVTTGKYSSFKQAQKLWISQKDFFNKETGQWATKPVGKFHFASGMMNKLTSENKMTEAQAKAFHDATKAKYGVDYGFCCVCGKLLTVKKSIDKGIGPKCAGKL